MDTVGLITGCFRMVCLTLLFTSTYVRTTKKACIKQLPRPTNLKVSASKPGQYNLTWDCDLVDGLPKAVYYRVEVKKTPESTWEATRVTFKHISRNTVLSKHLSFRVKTEIGGGCSGNYSNEIRYVPEGMNGTAAENTSCVLYNMSSMSCMWTAGIEAPDDTRYTLSLMQNGQVKKCQDYKKDSLGREVACRVQYLKINLMEEVYILIEGQSNKSKILFFDQWFQPFETGIDGTAAGNVSCVAYNTSSMNCTWNAGIKAPDDTRYTLSLWQKEKWEECHHYKKDSLGREITCRIDDLKIHLMENTCILIKGESNKVKIRVFDQWFQPSKTEILNPPSNITVDLNKQDLRVQWEKPQTSYYAGNHCFKYDISVMEKLYSVAFNEQPYTIPIQRFKAGQQYSLKMRASGLKCGFTSEWGEWSRPIQFDIPGKSYQLTILAVLIAPVMTLLLLLCVCKRYKLKQKIWPPVPQPKNNLNDFQKELNSDMEVTQKDIFEYHGIHENEDLTIINFEKVPLK